MIEVLISKKATVSFPCSAQKKKSHRGHLCCRRKNKRSWKERSWKEPAESHDDNAIVRPTVYP